MADQRNMGKSSRSLAVAAALTLYAVWTLATWLLEGRIETLLRPEAALDRAAYAIIANLLIGILGAMVVLRFLVRWRSVDMPAAESGRSGSSAVRIIIGLALGLAFYLLQGSPSLDPIVLMNAFSQVLVVSAAEVVVCWAVVGAVMEAVLRSHGHVVSIIGAALVASALFGLYHFAHSAPFNTPGMVALLSVVGLLTSAFFFIVRDIYATIAFHNFLGMFGVVQALAVTGQLGAFTALQPPLLIMAVATIAVLWLSDRTLLRGSQSRS
jgi:hypothetical protein